MKYICLGYMEPGQFEAVPGHEEHSGTSSCKAYRDELQRNGQLAGDEVLQSPENAVTLRWKNGKANITDGPYAETKEQLGGIIVVEAKDIDGAVQLMVRNPSAKGKSIEVRPLADVTEMIRESDKRRSIQRAADWTKSLGIRNRLPGTLGAKKYVCLGYIDSKEWESVPEGQQAAMIDACVAYDDELRNGGHFAGGDALGDPAEAVTLRWKGGKPVVTDGPYAETKEQLGGILILEANDLNHAIQLMSKHPGVKMGPFEIRPVLDQNGASREKAERSATAGIR